MARLSYIVTIVTISISLMCILAEELYSDQYDDIDVEGILHNDTVRYQYYNCYMGTAPCLTPDAAFFKVVFADALLTDCKKCTPKQKEFLEIVPAWYIKNHPDEWEALVAHSPENIKMKN